MSVPEEFPTDEKLDELDRIREQLTHRFATANGRRLIGVMVAYRLDEVELIFERLEGETCELLLTVPLAGPLGVGSISLDALNALDYDEDYAEERRTPLDEEGIYGRH